MELHQFTRLKTAIATQTSAAQILEIEQVVHLVVARQVAEIALARRTDAVVAIRACPRCASQNVVRHGKERNGRERFMCRGCHRTYNILTCTSMARARKPEKWSQYLRCMTDHLSIRKIVKAGIGVNHVTVWRWRHRFLTAVATNNTAILSGVIEADETFFLRSLKGHRGWTDGNPPENRAARPRAWGAIKRGLSSEQVPVLTALDNAGGIYEAILPSLTAIEASLHGRIAPGSVVCSDGTKAYVRAAVKAGAEHRRVIVPTSTPTAMKANPVRTKQRKKGRLGLGHVNAHHNKLKLLVNWRCRGVATKYLANYLGWHRAMCHDGFKGSALLDRALV